jgi:acyl-CoA thioester hydrolase
MFDHEIRVGDDDIDMLGHASNIAFLRWIQEAAIAHSEAMGLGVDAYMRMGAFFVVRRHEIDYLRPVLRGSVLQMRTWIDSAAAAKCERCTDIRLTTAPDVSVAKARTTWGFVEAATGRPTRIPDDIRVAFGFSPRKSTPAPPAVVAPRADDPVSSSRLASERAAAGE